jgi:hypothetical protein
MSRSIVIIGASKGIGRAARRSLQQSHFLPGRELPSSRVRPYSWMEAQAWGVSRTRNARSEFLDCTPKPFSDRLQMVRSLNPQIATAI